LSLALLLIAVNPINPPMTIHRIIESSGLKHGIDELKDTAPLSFSFEIA